MALRRNRLLLLDGLRPPEHVHQQHARAPEFAPARPLRVFRHQLEGVVGLGGKL